MTPRRRAVRIRMARPWRKRRAERQRAIATCDAFFAIFGLRRQA